MTFSRPATRGVNALTRPGRPNRVELDRIVVRQGAQGAFRDFSSPAQAGRNAARPYQELASFLEGVVGEGGPLQFAAAMDLNKDIDAFGTLSKDPAFMEAYRQGDEGVRAQVNSLRPEVQSMAGMANAKSATLLYSEILATEAPKVPVLNERPTGLSDQDWQKQRATEFAKLRQQAADASGLSRIQPEYLAPQMAAIGQVEAQVKAQSYKNISANDKKRQDSAFSNSFGSELRALTYGAQQAYSDTKLTDQQRDLAVVNSSRAVLQTQIDQLAPYRVSSEIVDVIWSGMTTEISTAMAGGSSAGIRNAQRMVTLFGLMARQDDIKLPGGVSLGGYRFEDGSTVAGRVARLNVELEGKLEQAQQKEAWNNPTLMQFALQGALGQLTPEQMPQVASAIGQIAMQSGGGVQMFTQMYGTIISNRNTAEQIRQERELPQVLEIETELTRANRTEKDVTAARARILNSGLSPATQIRLLKDNRATSEGSASGVARARAYNELEITQAGEQIAIAQERANQRLAASGNPQAAGAVQADAKKEARDIAITATRMTEKRVADMEAKGISVDQDQYNQIYRNELTAATRSRVKSISTPVEPEQKSYAQSVVENYNFIQQKLRDNGGQRSIDIFPPSVRQFAQKQGYPMTYPGLQRAFIEQMKAATEPSRDGSGKQVQVFPEPGKAWRQLFDNSRRPSSMGPQSSLPNDRRTAALSQLTQQLGIGGPDLPQEPVAKAAPTASAGKPAAPRTGGGQQVAAAPRMSIPEQLVGGALNMLLGVQPAAAQGMPNRAPAPDPVAMSMPALKVLNDLFRGVQQMTIRTPVLPQAAANAQSARVPLAINNDKHPFFIAIGINEGTRTADGGYTKNYFGHTDPGNGARNVGTVSGQQGGSPQQSDRRWAGILTQTAASVAPIISRLGLEQGTVGFNRVLFNVLDLKVQAPAAVSDFIKKLPGVLRQGVTVEAIAKARADSFINPATGRLETTFGSYDRLLRDQRSRAGAFDYKRRL